MSRTREMIWAQVIGGIEQGYAAMIWGAPTDQGYVYETTGRNRRISSV